MKDSLELSRDGLNLQVPMSPDPCELALRKMTGSFSVGRPHFASLITLLVTTCGVLGFLFQHLVTLWLLRSLAKQRNGHESRQGAPQSHLFCVSRLGLYIQQEPSELEGGSGIHLGIPSVAFTAVVH